MKNEYTININAMKKNYKYDENNYEELEAVMDKFIIKCYTKIGNIIKKTEELILKLRDYKGPKKNDKQKYLPKLERSMEDYQSLKNKIFMDWLFYTELMRDFKAHIKVHNKINYVEELCKKNTNEVLHLVVQKLIQVDINILNQLNLINYLNFLFIS